MQQTTTTLFIQGYTGRMGLELQNIYAQNPYKFMQQPWFSKKRFPTHHSWLGLQPTCGTQNTDIQRNILLDFSTIQGSLSLAKECLEFIETHGYCPFQAIVLATTGFGLQDWAVIQPLTRHCPIFHIPNFSLGILIFQKIGQFLQKTFPDLANNMHLHDIHHKKKLDAPSGTAVLLAKHWGLQPNQISAARVGEVVGEHTILWSGNYEELALTHKALSRSVFARGALDTIDKLCDTPQAVWADWNDMCKTQILPYLGLAHVWSMENMQNTNHANSHEVECP
jgi:dihydrodipicolinate reductase